MVLLFGEIEVVDYLTENGRITSISAAFQFDRNLKLLSKTT